MSTSVQPVRNTIQIRRHKWITSYQRVALKLLMTCRDLWRDCFVNRTTYKYCVANATRLRQRRNVMHVKGESEYYWLVMDGDEAVAICATHEEAQAFAANTDFTLRRTQKIGEEKDD